MEERKEACPVVVEHRSVEIHSVPDSWPWVVYRWMKQMVQSSVEPWEQMGEEAAESFAVQVEETQTVAWVQERQLQAQNVFDSIEKEKEEERIKGRSFEYIPMTFQ